MFNSVTVVLWVAMTREAIAGVKVILLPKSRLLKFRNVAKRTHTHTHAQTHTQSKIARLCIRLLSLAYLITTQRNSFGLRNPASTKLKDFRRNCGNMNSSACGGRRNIRCKDPVVFSNITSAGTKSCASSMRSLPSSVLWLHSGRSDIRAEHLAQRG